MSVADLKRTMRRHPAETIDAFHELYYHPAHSTKYLDHTLWKSPTDVFVLQEILWEVKPDLIVECGTAFGASALWMAHFMDLHIPEGRIWSVDIEPSDHFHGHVLPKHKRITYVRGRTSVDPEVVEMVGDVAMVSERVLVILDSLHTQEHVHAEMEAYASMVSVGSYLIVEDTNVGPNDKVYPAHGFGPGDAVRQWFSEDHAEKFESDDRWQRYLISFHHLGWLRRVA